MKSLVDVAANAPENFMYALLIRFIILLTRLRALQ